MIENCYATGTVNGTAYVGGLVGYAGVGDDWEDSWIKNCYSTGAVTGYPYMTTNPYSYPFVGGFVGLGASWNINCFRDIDTSGQTNSGAGPIIFGRTTAQMKQKTTFTDHGWDFVGEEINGPNDIWYIRAGEYPRLTWQNHRPTANAGADQDVYVQTADAKAANYFTWLRFERCGWGCTDL